MRGQIAGLRADFRSERGDSKLEKADFRSERVDFMPDRADFRPERADFRPERAEFRPGPGGPVCLSINCLSVHNDCPGMCECVGRGRSICPGTNVCLL